MTSALSTALSGLRVAQQQINVISANVSNVGTPGYTRKVLPQSTQVIEGRAIGVQPETIIRNVDLNLTRNLWTQISATGELDIQSAYLSRIEQFHGPPDKELSIAAELSALKDSFSALSDSPEDVFLQSITVNKAEDTANKINDLSALITTLRNDAQDEMQSVINRINGLLEQIGELNTQVKSNINLGRSTATAEDQRDEALKELSSLIEISFFQRGDGVLVIQTNQGVELAGDSIEQLFFDPTPQSATTFYPDSAAPIYVGDPDTNPASFDITANSPGGILGGLITLRDTTFPKQMAQLDEMAHKMALRFAAQGLNLFTDGTGTIPADTAPDPTTLPNPTPVEYVGFSAVIQVNDLVIADNSLLQSGTYGASIDTGSNEVIRRVIENTFTNINFETAENTDTTTQVDLLNTDGNDLQNWLGLFSENTIAGTRDISGTAAAPVNLATTIANANGALDDPNDQFQISFTETRNGIGTMTITVDLSVAAALVTVPNNGATQLATHINNLVAAAVGGTPAFAGLGVTASAGPNGEIVINTRGSYEIDSNFGATGIGQTGLNFLGLADNAGSPVAPTDPYFDIRVGNNNPTRITIEPGDFAAQLEDKLFFDGTVGDAGVPGLGVDRNLTALGAAPDGLLRLRPGDDFDNPNFGGDITITGGPFETNGAAYAGSAGPVPPATTGTRATIDDGANIVSALFGTYSGTGATLQDLSAITSTGYGSETNGSLAIPIPTIPFRESLLGPNADISTNIIGSSNLIDFAQKMVNEHSQEIILLSSRAEDEQALQDLLETQLINESGVNLDEELSNMIVVQTAYSASARVITVVDELFQELLNTI